MRTAILGGGAMGKVLAGMVEEKEGYELAGVIEPLQGQKPEDLGGFDVIIDFSNPANLQMLADYCRANNCPAVIATTGFEADQLKEIEKLAEAHPDIEICIGNVDRELNDNAYICPGLGDAGDRIFGTK